MHVNRSALSGFERRSVALLATLAMAAGAATAQSAAPAQVPGAQKSAQAAESIPPNRWTLAQIEDAFRKTDGDNNGAISRQEATMWTGLSRSFDKVDSDHDGVISRAEFDEALK